MVDLEPGFYLRIIVHANEHDELHCEAIFLDVELFRASCL
jgi:hypothetical protein